MKDDNSAGWTREQLDSYLASKSDDDLRRMTREACEDMKKACKAADDEDWHNACFAAVLGLSGELKRRGIKMDNN